MTDLLYRRNVVLETLRANRRELRRLLISDDADQHSLRDILSEASKRKIKPESISRKDIDRLAKGENHQGIMIEVGTYPYAELDEILSQAQTLNEPPLLLLLDLVQDPANVGRLIRTADACGIHGVLLPDKGSGEITTSVVVSSMGASEHMKVVRIGNMARTIDMLKKEEIWIAGLDLSPEAQRIDKIDLNRPLGIVVGNEGSGIRRLVREKCDLLISLPMRGHVQSLNAAIAGSIVMYAAWEARGYRN